MDDKIHKRLIQGAVTAELIQHVGQSQAIGMAELYQAVYGRSWDHRINDTRDIRRVVTELRRAGVPICSSPAKTGGGYYLASVGSELEDYLQKLEAAGLAKLGQAAKIRRVGLVELLGQMSLNLSAEDGTDAEAA